MNGQNGNNDNWFLDFVSVVSLFIGLQNLRENEEQSAQNDVQAANDKQAEFLLKEINGRFEEQNATLGEILQILKELRRK